MFVEYSLVAIYSGAQNSNTSWLHICHMTPLNTRLS